MTEQAKVAFAAYLAVLVAAGEVSEDKALEICRIIKEENHGAKN